MHHLTDFCNWLNYEVGGNGPLPNLLHGDYGTAMGQSLERHFVDDRQRGGVRMSNLGKPATTLALAKLGYTEPEPKGKSRIIFHIGDMFENFLEVMLQSYGIKVLDSQMEIEYMGVKGHADYLIESPVNKQPLIVEAKTMSENYSRLFSKTQDDDRGYVTQLAMYSRGMGHDASWICFNKGTATTFELSPPPGAFDAALMRAEEVLKRLEKVKTIEDVLTYFRPPPPIEEKYKRQPTGKFLLPVSMKMSPFRTALYITSQDYNGYNKFTEYVDDYASPEHMKKEIEFLVETGQVMVDE